MNDSLYPKLHSVPPPKVERDGVGDASYCGEPSTAAVLHQVKLLESEAVELRKNIAALLNERNAAQAEATEWRKRCNSGQLGWLAPYDADSLRRDVDRIREERDELRRNVDLLHTPEEMAEAVEAARNAGIEAAAKLRPCVFGNLKPPCEPGDSCENCDQARAIRALKRSTSEKAP